jgi:hypothetical protein
VVENRRNHKFPDRRVSGKEDIMKSKKRQAIKQAKAEARKRYGKPGSGKSKYALKQKIDNRPGSPFKTTIRIVEEETE